MAGEVEGDRMAVKIAHARTPPNNQCAWSNFSSNFFLLLWHVLHILSLRIDTSHFCLQTWKTNMLTSKGGKFVRSQHKLVWYAGYLKMNSLTVGYGLWVMHNRLNFCIALMVLLTARFCVCYDAASCVGGDCAGDLGSHTGTASMLLLAPPLWANHLSHIHHRWPLLSSKMLVNYYFWFSAETEGADHLPLIPAL